MNTAQAGELSSSSPTATGQPTLSVVVPSYNSADKLEQCLAALAGSDTGDFEVLVVDDGSTQALEPIVAKHGFGYMRIQGPGGPGRARTLGVDKVGGQYVVFVDADVCVHPDTLGLIAKAFEKDPAIGSVVGTYDDTPAYPSFLSQYKNLFHHYVHQSCDGDISTFWAGCGAIRRELFLEMGGFDQERYKRPSIEDIELGMRISAAGHRIVLDRQVQCKHLKRWTLWNLLKTDIFDRGVPWTQLMLRHGGLKDTLNVKRSQQVSVLLVGLALLSAVIGIWVPMACIGTAGLIAAVTIINWDFYRYFAARRGAWFTLRVAPLHWLYFFYCGLSFAIGRFLHLLEGSSPLPSPLSPPLSSPPTTQGHKLKPDQPTG